MIDRIWEDYSPSPQAQRFHDNNSRFSHLVWGIKSGKTHVGPYELLKRIYADPQASGSLYWIVAPTYLHVDTCQFELEKVLYKDHENNKIVEDRWKNKRLYLLENGAYVQLRSCEWPDNLRGPNIRGIWGDEEAYMKEEAWSIIRGRIAATDGWYFGTTTPNTWNWLWDECQRTKFDDQYGEFQKGDHFVTHYPTWDFPWVSKDYIEDERATMPKDRFDQEYGALFVSSHRAVFNNINACVSYEPIVQVPDAKYVIGLDLGKQQDFTAYIVMDGRGQVLDLDHWSGVDWLLQRERVVELADKWQAIVVLDESNVGAVFLEDIRDAGVNVHGIATNAFQVKQDLIQALQMAFERCNIKLPSPNGPDALREAATLIEELKKYQVKITAGGRIGYSAPKRMHDDFVIALALANWGKKHGLAGGGLTAAAISIKRDDWAKQSSKKAVDRRRKGRRLNRIAQRRRTSGLFGDSGGMFWNQ